MIGIFSQSLFRAFVTASAWLALFAGAAATIVHLLPPRMLLVYFTGPNLSTLIPAIPIVASVIDWCDNLIRKAPIMKDVGAELIFLSTLQAISAIASPASLIAWGSLAALTACISSLYWMIHNVVQRWLGPTRMSMGNFVFHSFAINVLMFAVLSAAFQFLGVYMEILSAAVGETLYIACALLAGTLSLLLTIFIGPKVPDTAGGVPETPQSETASEKTSDGEQVKRRKRSVLAENAVVQLAHVRLTAVAAACCTMVCALAQLVGD